jgi:hypothetical protein
MTPGTGPSNTSDNRFNIGWMGVTIWAVVVDTTGMKIYMTRTSSQEADVKFTFPSARFAKTDTSPCKAASRAIYDLTQCSFEAWGLLRALNVGAKSCMAYFTQSMSPEIDKALAANNGQWQSLEGLDGIRTECEQVREVATDAKRLVYTKKVTKSLTSIPAALSRTKAALLESFSREGSDSGGWNPRMEERRPPGIIGTSLGLRALLATGYPRFAKEVRMARQFLKKHQNPDGGWTFMSSRLGKTRGPSISESTSLALMALLDAGEYVQRDCVVRGYEWLKRNCRADGGWGLTRDSDKSRVLATTLALEALSVIRDLNSEYQGGLKWLIDAQSEQGCWGLYSYRSDEGKRQSCSASHTARAIACIVEHRDVYSEAINRALHWLEEAHQHNRGFEAWSGTTEYEEFGQDDFMTWFHFAVPWCAKAMVKCDVWIKSDPLLEGLQSIIETQDSKGLWQPPDPDWKPVWAVYDCVSALCAVKEFTFRRLFVPAESELEQQRIAELEDLMGRLNESIDTSRATTVDPTDSLRRCQWAWTFAIVAWIGIVVLGWWSGLWKTMWKEGLAYLGNQWVVGICSSVLGSFLYAFFRWRKSRLRGRKKSILN